MELSYMHKLRSLCTPLLFLFFVVLASCGDDEPTPTTEPPLASFSTVVSDLTVTFTNNSTNAVSSSWNFGDGNTSTEDNPTHTYASGGTYTVVLTVTSADGEVDDFQENVSVLEDPTQFLHGGSTREWKLVREGTSMLLASDSDFTQIWWAGSSNNGERPCLYDDAFTFGADGSFAINDGGTFWAEFGVFNGGPDNTGCDSNTTPEGCFEAIPANMVNECGDDVSAWLSATHSYTYDEASGQITISGDGAWIGIPKLGTSGTHIVPQAATTFNVVFSSGGDTQVDTMFVNFDYGAGFWPFTYVSYRDTSLEPDIVTIAAPFGKDLENITPDVMSHTFETENSFQVLGVIGGGSTITVGVDDPLDATAAKVAQFDRTDAQFQEAKLRAINAENDSLDFIPSNLTTISLDVFLPGTNDYSGALSRKVLVGFADESQTEQWWTDIYQYESADDLALDQWITLTFDVATPNNREDSPADRTGTELDMVYINIGGSDHNNTGTFYIRNFVIE